MMYWWCKRCRRWNDEETPICTCGLKQDEAGTYQSRDEELFYRHQVPEVIRWLRMIYELLARRLKDDREGGSGPSDPH